MAGTPTSGGPIELSIRSKLAEAFAPLALQVLNESHMHSGPVLESHFKVVVVSTAFESRNLVGRHRLVNTTLREELDGGVHALSIEALTPEQWAERNGTVRDSPLCRGGSKSS